jgi:3-oxoacyl-[acyl-carrier protein] reductase
MSNRIELVGRRAIVTAASAGIGSQIASTLAACGAAVAINYRSNDAAAEALIHGIRSAGGRAFAVKGDASDAGSINAIVETAYEQLGGPIDLAVANHGPFRLCRLDAMTPAAFDEMVHGNLSSAFYLARAVMPQMKLLRRGVILTVGLSPAADSLDGAPHIGAYACAKAALASLTRSMAAELAPCGVRVAMVAPGLIGHDAMSPTQMRWMAERVPAGRLGAPKEVADVVAFLASDMAAYTSGCVVSVAGGWHWGQDRTTHFDSREILEVVGHR